MLISLIICALGATNLALYIQAKYQRYTSATQAALIYTLEPIFASLFGVWINHEQLSLQLYLGGAIIILSLALPVIRMILRAQLLNRS